MSKHVRAGFTLMELLVLVIGIGLVAALIIPAIHRAQQRAMVASCSGNLSQMWKLMNIYRSQFGCSGGKSMPIATGSAFWRILENKTPPLIDEVSACVFLCPVRGGGAIGDLHYWGPGKRVARLNDMEPVGCDAMGERPNHGNMGCNMLRKSSDVLEISKEDWDNLDQGYPGFSNGPVMTRPIP